MLQSKVIGWLHGFKKQDKYIGCLLETDFRSKGTQTKSKVVKKIFHVILI